MNQKNFLGNVLLISPSFFSYHTIIKNELENQGYLVDWIDDRAGAGFLIKALLRLFPTCFTKFLEKKFIKIFENLDENKYDVIFVIKGEGLSSNGLRFLKKKFNRASLGLYLWDGVKNAKNSVKLAELFDVVSTFDLEDSKRNNWHYRPLFCKNIDFEKNKSECDKYSYDISFIGTLHSDRHRIVKKIFENYSKKYELFFYLYVNNFLLKLYKSFFDSSVIFSTNNLIKYNPIKFSEYKTITNNSKAVLDIEHPDQNGFTMRTIETIISGKKLITTNKNIINSNLYHPSRILMINRNNPIILDDFMNSNFSKLNEDLMKYYSIECWVKELIDLQKKRKNKSLH